MNAKKCVVIILVLCALGQGFTYATWVFDGKPILRDYMTPQNERTEKLINAMENNKNILVGDYGFTWDWDSWLAREELVITKDRDYVFYTNIWTNQRTNKTVGLGCSVWTVSTYEPIRMWQCADLPIRERQRIETFLNKVSEESGVKIIILPVGKMPLGFPK